MFRGIAQNEQLMNDSSFRLSLIGMGQIDIPPQLSERVAMHTQLPYRVCGVCSFTHPLSPCITIYYQVGGQSVLLSFVVLCFSCGVAGKTMEPAPDTPPAPHSCRLFLLQHLHCIALAQQLESLCPRKAPRIEPRDSRLEHSHAED